MILNAAVDYTKVVYATPEARCATPWLTRRREDDRADAESLSPSGREIVSQVARGWLHQTDCR